MTRKTRSGSCGLGYQQDNVPDLAETAEGVLMKFLSSLLLAAALAQAAVAPNPGGQDVVTNSTTSSYVTVQTPVTQQVNQYSTTLKAILNGSQTVFQQTY